MGVGRKRKSNPLGLPPRVYAHHGAFYYAHKGGKWEHLGNDLARAIAEGQRRANLEPDTEAIAAWWKRWTAHLAEHVGKPSAEGGIAKRTYTDYVGAWKMLGPRFGDMRPRDVIAKDVVDFLEDHRRAGRGSRANKEKAAFSVFFSWLINRHGHETGLTHNPCSRTGRNQEAGRERYVTDEEYLAAYERAPASVRLAMALAYRTLQRPSDILSWKRTLIREINGRRVLHFRQSKTRQWISIAIEGELERLLPEDPPGTPPSIGPLVARNDGKPYSLGGLSAMLKRAIKGERLERDEDNEPDDDSPASFGLQDLKAKGATDLYYRQGAPLERIRDLCGHKNLRTTEIYVKKHGAGVFVVEPNQLVIGGAQ